MLAAAVLEVTAVVVEVEPTPLAVGLAALATILDSGGVTGAPGDGVPAVEVEVDVALPGVACTICEPAPSTLTTVLGVAMLIWIPEPRLASAVAAVDWSAPSFQTSKPIPAAAKVMLVRTGIKIRGFKNPLSLSLVVTPISFST